MALLALATGCGQRNTKPAPTTNETASQAAPNASPACTRSDQLPVTRLCRDRAASLMLTAPDPKIVAPEGCSWTVGEVAVSPTRAILYRAAKCRDRTAKLAYVPSGKFANLTLIASPYEEPLNSADVMVRMTTARDRDALLKIARGGIADAVERARCQVRMANIAEWPADALVIDEVPAPPADGIRSACGELGLDEGSQTFWRLGQGQGWFFQLGQESPVVDAGSFTRIHRTANGEWQRD